MPGDADLSCAAALGGGDLVDHGVIQDRAALTTNRRVALKGDTPLLVEPEHVSLVQVGMDLDLIHDGLDLTSCKQVHHHRDRAVADSNGLGKTFLDKLLHLLPQDMEGRRLDLPVLTLEVNRQDHPVDHVAVNIVKLELLKGGSAGALNVAIVRAPQLRRHVEVLSSHSRRHALLQGFTDFSFVFVHFGRIDVSVAVLQNCTLHGLLRDLLVLKGSKTDDGDFGPIV